MVYSGDDWGDISSGDDDLDNVPVDSVADKSDSINDSDSTNENFFEKKYFDFDLPLSFLDKGKYTRNFYIALGVGGIGILIIILFFILFVRSPKNKWNKKVVKK